MRAVNPAMKLLRLADSNEPHMCQLYYFVRKVDDCISKSLDDEAFKAAFGYGDVGEKIKAAWDKRRYVCSAV